MPTPFKTSIALVPDAKRIVDERRRRIPLDQSATINELIRAGGKAEKRGTPTLSTCGGAFVTDEEAARLAIAAGHCIVVTPGAVSVQGRAADGAAALVVFNVGDGVLTLVAGGQVETKELDGRELGAQIDALAAAIAESRRRADEGDIDGQVIASSVGGVVWIGSSPDGPGFKLTRACYFSSLAVLYGLMGELAALMSRWLRGTGACTAALDQALASSPELVGAGR
jgi:hypothetical protein